MADGLLNGPLAEHIARLRLVDHHVHGALAADVERSTFESMITEAPRAPKASTQFDSQIGFAIRRWCAPLLDLAPHAHADDYWHRRLELGVDEVNRRLLRATGTRLFLIDTGHDADHVLDPAQHAEAAGAEAEEVVRLESVAEDLLVAVDSPGGFVEAYPQTLAALTTQAVATKSIAAYRWGLHLEPSRPRASEVASAAERHLASTDARLTDPVLLRYLLWCAVDRGLPIQIHCGYGDPDLDLDRANPLLLTGWLRAMAPTGVPVLLLHNYPFHREAGYLAQVFDHVYFDVGLGINYVGAQSMQLVAESLELAPFHKQLFSSDAWGPSELHVLGAMLWRRAMATVIGRWVEDNDWSQYDAERVTSLIAHQNAERVYSL